MSRSRSVPLFWKIVTFLMKGFGVSDSLTDAPYGVYSRVRQS
jgi:hypothetical protein